MALGSKVLLERFDEAVMVDHAITRTSAAPSAVWTGLGHLEGQAVWAQSQAGATRARVAAGTITLPTAATSVTVGTPYSHRVEPLPLAVPAGSGPSLDRPYRPVRIVFRLLATTGLHADTGTGLRPLPLDAGTGATLFTGDAAVRASGWRRGSGQPPWLVEQDEPAFCTILSVTSEIMGNT